ASLERESLANEYNNRLLQKFSDAVIHPVVSGASVLALRDQIRRERAKKTPRRRIFRRRHWTGLPFERSAGRAAATCAGTARQTRDRAALRRGHSKRAQTIAADQGRRR